jgi:hypothetical protein
MDKQSHMSADAGWIPMEDFLLIVHHSLTRVQKQLEELATEGGHLVLKDLKLDLPAEVAVDVKTKSTNLRFPVRSRLADDQFRDEHLSRISFSVAYVPIAKS